MLSYYLLFYGYLYIYLFFVYTTNVSDSSEEGPKQLAETLIKCYENPMKTISKRPKIRKLILIY